MCSVASSSKLSHKKCRGKNTVFTHGSIVYTQLLSFTYLEVGQREKVSVEPVLPGLVSVIMLKGEQSKLRRLVPKGWDQVWNHNWSGEMWVSVGMAVLVKAERLISTQSTGTNMESAQDPSQSLLPWPEQGNMNRHHSREIARSLHGPENNTIFSFFSWFFRVRDDVLEELTKGIYNNNLFSFFFLLFPFLLPTTVPHYHK